MDKPGSVATVGAVGDDLARTVCENAMKEAGITPLYKVVEGGSTGFRVTYDDIDPLTRKLTCCRLTAPRAAMDYEPEDFMDKDTKTAIAKTSWLYLDAGSIWADFDAAWKCDDQDAAIHLADRISADGQRIVLNVSLIDIVDDAEVLLRHLITLADVIIMNQKTAERFWEQDQEDGHSDWEKGAYLVANQQHFDLANRSRTPREETHDVINWVVVTREGDDVAVVEGHPVNKSKTKLSYVKLPPVEEPEFAGWMPSDRRGVGDLFAGGLTAGLAKGQTVEEAVLTGHKLAAYSMTQEGPKLPPQRAE